MSNQKIKPLGLKLAEARKCFHAKMATGEVQKTGWNPHTKSKFWELGDVVSPALECLSDAGIAPMPMTCKGPDAIMELMCCDTGEVYAVCIPLGSAKLPAAHDIQNKGAVLSYCRRYLWLQVMECVDVDVVEQSKAPKNLDPKGPATDEQWKVINKAIKDGSLPEATRDWMHGEMDKGKEITLAQASTIIKRIKMQEKESNNE